MALSAIFAFLHHLAAFALVAALAVEFVLIRGELTLANARSLQRADIVYGIAAGAILIIGFLRVFYFEKGAEYYFSSHTFLTKLTVFAIVGLISIIPTIEFLSWRKTVAQGNLPVIPPAKLRRLRMIIHIELAGIVVILLCAALMARGIG
jgi:putative membrane protein